MIHLYGYEDNSFGSSMDVLMFLLERDSRHLFNMSRNSGKKYNDSNKTQLKKARNKPKSVPYSWHCRDTLIIILSPAPERHTTMSNWVFAGVFIHI